MDRQEKYHWEVVGDLLVLWCGDEQIVPAADQIYESIFERSSVYSELEPGKPKYLPELSFSKYPVPLVIEISYTPEQGGSGITCRVLAVSEEGNVPVDSFSTREADHIVIAGKWYPFEPGSLQQIGDILNTAGADSAGVVPFRAYLNLKKVAQESDFVLDHTDGKVIQSEFSENLGSDALALFNGTLYPYQEDGWKWLSFLFREKLGGILADEMGLGKTVQIIAALANPDRGSVLPALIVAPSTLMENWRRETLKFAPSLITTIHQGPARTGLPSNLEENDVVITSYETVVRDGALFNMIQWKAVVLDEAQAIKNPKTRRAVSVKRLKRSVSIAVTGTPVENRLRDLWSLMDFVLPGYLGTESEFEQRFGNERQGAIALEPVVSPLLLRRRVHEVARDLPDRIDIPQVLNFHEEEIRQYEHIRKEIIAEYGKSATLVALTKLRMFCTHPFLLSEDLSCDIRYSDFTKFTRLFEILDEVFQNGDQALVFTSYNRMSDLIVRQVREQVGIFAEYIDGRTPVRERQKIVDMFSSIQGPGVLSLNPRAAGTGLNITAANHVIHYNLEWNPAVEDQASARAYRRGQDKPVTIHRLYFANTVEEVIDQRLGRKRDLADTAVVGVAGRDEEIEDLVRALQLTPAGIH